MTAFYFLVLYFCYFFLALSVCGFVYGQVCFILALWAYFRQKKKDRP